MPITLHDQPSYELACDRCGIPAEHDDGTPVQRRLIRETTTFTVDPA